MDAILIYIAGYLIGAIPFGVIVARSRGIDLFQSGSGNIGATNVARTLGKGAGSIVLALDVLKGFVPALVAALILGDKYGILPGEHALIAGACAVFGHTFSPFLGFRGGKGIATGLGMLFGSAPLVALVALGTFLVFLALTRTVSTSSLIAASTILSSGAVLGTRVFVLCVYGLLIVYVVHRHRANILRLWQGDEPRLNLIRKPGPSRDG